VKRSGQRGPAAAGRAATPSAGPLRALFDACRQAWTAPRSPQAVVLVLALWLTLVGNLALWRALAGLQTGARGLLVVAGVAVILLAAITTFLSLTAWSRWMKPLWLAVVLAAAVSQHYMLDFGAVIDTTMIANVVDTNVGEARDLLTWTLLGNVLLVAALPALWLVPLTVTGRSAGRTTLRVVGLFAVSLALGLAVTAAMYSVLAPLVRNNMGLRYLPNPVVPIWSAVKVAIRPLVSRPKALVAISAGAALGPSHAKPGKPPLLVLVVGETGRADHFALNGYPRDTTPELAARGVLSYRNVWSCGTNTLASVPCMFSSLGKTAFEKRQAEHENLLDVLQAAGMAVLWIDNQAGCKSVCDRVASASTNELAGTPAGARLCSENECLDEALLEGLDARIAALPAERRSRGVLLVMHQMGSHGPAYGRRSPPPFKRFQPECKTTTLGDCDHAELINVYDNSIAYTDHVLARTIDWLRAQDATFAPALLYLSDHGESLGEYGVFLHGVPYPFAPDTQKHIPMVAWLGDEIARRDRIDRACLRGRLDQRYSHDNLYHSVLGLLDVATPTYDAGLDIWSACKRRDEG
jgi:lipid A ethanolaminephosphotransferase